MCSKLVDVIDGFCGGGGTASGLLRDGRFRIIVGANHSPLAIATYAHNNPTIDTRQIDLQEIDPATLPPARVAIFTPECTNHSGAQARRIYAEGPAAFVDDPDDPEFTEYLRQERSRATMACSLRYAERHRPEFALHENVVEVAWWGVKVPGKKRGDGTTYQWWKNEWQKLGYVVHEIFANAAAFGAPQSRDRFIMLCRRKDVPMPNLEFTPDCWCFHCEAVVAGRQTWKKRTKAWPLEQWGRMGKNGQYFYSCPRCHQKAELITNGAYTIVDWSNLGETIGEREDRGKPLADSTVGRVEHGLKRLGGVEALVTMCRTPKYGADASVLRPMHTLTTRHDQMLATPPSMVVELRSGGSIKSGQRPTTAPMGAITGSGNHFYLATMPIAMWAKNNGGPTDTAYHAITDPIGTVCRVDTNSLVTFPERLAEPFDVRDVHLRMFEPFELQLGQTFDPTYEILGTRRQQVQLIGDAVPPVLAYAVAQRLGDALEGRERIAA